MLKDTDLTLRSAHPMHRDTVEDFRLLKAILCFYEHTSEQSDVSWDSEAELSDLEDFPQAEIDAQFDDSDEAERPWTDVATGRRGGRWRKPSSLSSARTTSDSDIGCKQLSTISSASPSRMPQCGAVGADARVAQCSTAVVDARVAQC